MPSFGNIYTATLGASQLESDNEHTLLTTNSSTSHVIKDVSISNNAGANLNAGKGSYLELNGHRVGTVSNFELSGDLIIPPNSTLKLINYSYPVAFQHQTEWFRANNSSPLYLKRSVVNVEDGSILGTLSENFTTTNSISTASEIIDVQSYSPRDISGNTHLFYYTHDSNSVQQVWTAGVNGRNTSGSSSIRYQNYKAFGFSPDRMFQTNNSYQNSFYTIENNRFYEHNGLNGSTGSGVGSIAAFMSTYATSGGGNVVENPTSSYPRGSFSLRQSGNDVGYWAFWIPSNSYTTSIYAFQHVGNNPNYNFRFDFPNGWQSTGSSSFCVSVDEANDKLFFWRMLNQNQVRRHECSVAWSTLKTGQSQSPSLKTFDATHQDTRDISLTATMPSSMAGVRLSNRVDGGFAHKGTDNNLYHYN